MFILKNKAGNCYKIVEDKLKKENLESSGFEVVSSDDNKAPEQMIVNPDEQKSEKKTDKKSKKKADK